MDIMSFIRSFPLKTFTAGEVLLSKGDPLTSLLAIRDGFIKVTSINTNGTERLVWIAGRYDIAPTEQLFSKHASAHFFYTALTDGHYYAVDKKRFLEFAQQDPKIMTEVAINMSLHYDDFLQRVDAVDNALVKERLMYTLCYLAKRLSADSTVNLYEYGLRLTHQDLATMIGSTRETTSLTLAELRKEGYISYSRQVFIVNVEQINNQLI